MTYAAMYVGDKALVKFLIKAAEIARRHQAGFIILRENVSNKVKLDNEDRTVTRTDVRFRKIFKRAGLEVSYMALVKFPEQLL